MITIDDLRNDERKSGFDHVNSAMGRNNIIPIWRAAAGGRAVHTVGAAWRGPTRRTAKEAAQDYCDYVNGGRVIEYVKTRKRQGRPDFYKDADGKLHVDLPGIGSSIKAKVTRKAPERDFIVRNKALVDAATQPHDLVEAKVHTGRWTIDQAVGALLHQWYENGYEGRLFLLLPTAVDHATWEWLASLDIAVLVGA